MIEVRSYSEPDFPRIKELWEEVFPGDPPWNRAEVAIPAKLEVHPELFLVATNDGQPIGTVLAGYDGHRGWLYAAAVSPRHRRKGVGAALVREAERRLRALGCGKLNLQVRATNDAVVGFYRALGYDVEERVSMGKRLTN
ncbi:MAG TPA: GNAT family acetyltransferase [Caulobacteraceae bacterium]|jgi:ribosomal protein S18 acetylase RimI-like enzyme|nr:GNAT family acetyltransferase [Caulobacteraceae bacterium]